MAGKVFGTPTANLNLEASPRMAHGVYIGRASVDGKVYPSVICYGAGGTDKFEVHLLKTTQDLLGLTLSVEIGDKVSDLIPWESEEVMRAKIYEDINKALSLLGLA